MKYRIQQIGYYYIWSPSTRREWIEICDISGSCSPLTSPSTRREWIEISCKPSATLRKKVSLHTEGVD